MKFYPSGVPYISILKDGNLTEKAGKQREKHFKFALEQRDKAKEVMMPFEEKKEDFKDVEGDGFFTEEEIDTTKVRKRIVDKRGNVLK